MLRIMAGLDPVWDSLRDVGRIRNKARSTIVQQYHMIQVKLKIEAYADIVQWAKDNEVQLNDYHRS